MRTAHPRKYPIRRKNQRQRQLYMLHKEEVLLNEITQPHYPTEHRFPGTLKILMVLRLLRGILHFYRTLFVAKINRIEY